jgi:galactoside O-acetyltransferase
MKNPFDPGYYGSEQLRSFGFASVGKNVRVARNCVIIGLENIELGDNCRIDSGTRMIAAEGYIRLGRYVHVHTNCLLGGRGGIELGDYSALSHDVCLISASDDFSGRWMFAGTVPAKFTKPIVASIVLGRHCAVCMQSCVLPGVTFGEGAVLAVHSMARKSLEPWGLYFGSPARLIKRREQRPITFQNEIENGEKDHGDFDEA